MGKSATRPIYRFWPERYTNRKQEPRLSVSMSLADALAIAQGSDAAIGALVDAITTEVVPDLVAYRASKRADAIEQAGPVPTFDRYKVELLPNGWVRIDDRESGLVGLFTQAGQPYSGDLSRFLDPATAAELCATVCPVPVRA